MRYLTKEWYQTMQDSGLGVSLRVDERASEYSEELYRTLRAEKLDAWLRDREEVCEFLGEPYDAQRERESFERFQERGLTLYQTRTPEHILSKVADPRLLALGYGTAEIRQAFADFSKDCERQTVQTMKQCFDERKAAGLDKLWTGEHSLHDSVIEAVRWEGEDLTIEFERDETEWPEIRAVRFHDTRILAQEKPLKNAWWLYDEIWRTGRGYEIHVLLWDGEPFELTLECTQPELIWTRPIQEC